MTTDPGELEVLVRDHRTTVYRHAFRLTRKTADAEDLTQEVFLKAMRSPTRCAPGSADAWLYRIALNLFRDHLRSIQRRPTLTFHATALEQQPGPTGRSTVAAPERIVVDLLFDDDVAAALAALHPVNREAVLMCDVDGLTYDEIAATLGVSRGTVGSRISRGRAQLRTSLIHRSPAR